MIANNIENIWQKHSKIINIIKCSKAWWNNNYNQDFKIYKQTRQLKGWKKFKKTVKRTKREFFDNKINEITNKKYRPWELIN